MFIFCFFQKVHFVSCERGHVNALLLKANPGSKAYRYHVRITLVTEKGVKKCLTEKFSPDDAKKDLPISFQEMRIIYQLLSAAYEITNNFGASDVDLVYDNKSILFTSKPLQVADDPIILSPDQWGDAREYLHGSEVIVEIVPSKLGALDLNDKRFFASQAAAGREDHDLRSFYELLTTQGSQDKYLFLYIIVSIYFLFLEVNVLWSIMSCLSLAVVVHTVMELFLLVVLKRMLVLFKVKEVNML